MPWDFLRDLQNGDWQFSGNRDYSGVTGTMLIQQRMSINLKIPRGSFVYDSAKTLGSRLYDLLHTDFDRGLRDAPDIVREALAGMDDISIDEIQVLPSDDQRQLRIRIKYHPLVPADFAQAPLEGGTVEIPFNFSS
jgi:hypothetical protein